VFKLLLTAPPTTAHFCVKTLVGFTVNGFEIRWIVVESVSVAVMDVVSRGDGAVVVDKDGHVERDRRLLGDRMGPEVFSEVPPVVFGIAVVPEPVEENGLSGLVDPLTGVAGAWEFGVDDEHVVRHVITISSRSKSCKQTQPRFSVQTGWAGVPVSPKRVMT